MAESASRAQPATGPALNPIVTTLQGLLDVATATQPPAGYGHVHAASDYLKAWADLTAPVGWTGDGMTRIETALRERRL